MACLDGLREGVDVLAGDLLGDGGKQKARGEAGVLGLLCDESGCGLNGDGVEFAGGCAVKEASDGLAGDPDGVDVGQAVAASLDGADDLVYIDGLEVDPLRLRTCICGAASAAGKLGSSSVSVVWSVATERPLLRVKSMDDR